MSDIMIVKHIFLLVYSCFIDSCLTPISPSLCSHARFCSSIPLHWQCIWSKFNQSTTEAETDGPNKCWNGNLFEVLTLPPCHSVFFLSCAGPWVKKEVLMFAL